MQWLRRRLSPRANIVARHCLAAAALRSRKHDDTITRRSPSHTWRLTRDRNLAIGRNQHPTARKVPQGQSVEGLTPDPLPGA